MIKTLKEFLLRLVAFIIILSPFLYAYGCGAYNIYQKYIPRFILQTISEIK